MRFIRVAYSASRLREVIDLSKKVVSMCSAIADLESGYSAAYVEKIESIIRYGLNIYPIPEVSNVSIYLRTFLFLLPKISLENIDKARFHIANMEKELSKLESDNLVDVFTAEGIEREETEFMSNLSFGDDEGF